jgi:predicted DNA-binding transcriptional regulator AlpA
MKPETLQAVRAILRADASLSDEQRGVMLKAMKHGGEQAPTRNEPRRILRRREAAALLGRSVRTIDEWARVGLIRKVRLPGRARACGFSSAELERVATMQ